MGTNIESEARLAAEEGDSECLERLLRTHTELIFTEYEDGRTLLHLACLSGHVTSLETLLRAHADPTARCREHGRTGLHLAALHGHRDVTATLLREGADPEAEDKSGYQPIHVAAQSGFHDIIGLLLNNGACASARTRGGMEPLHVACREGHLETVSRLLGEGASVHSADDYSFAPLHFAAQRGHLAVVQMLVRRGACAEAADFTGLTPLLLAEKGRHPETERFLRQVLSSGGQAPRVPCLDGDIPYIDGESEERAGGEAGAEAVGGIGDTGTECQQIQADVAIRKYQRELRAAVENAEVKAVDDLVKKVPSGRPKSAIITESGALFVASELGINPIIGMLLDNEADPNATDKEGMTALHTACVHGHACAVRLLLNHGACVDATEKKAGYRPMHFACQHGHRAVVKELLRCHADGAASDDYMQSPMDVAKKHGWKDVVQLLGSHVVTRKKMPVSRPASAPDPLAATSDSAESRAPPGGVKDSGEGPIRREPRPKTYPRSVKSMGRDTFRRRLRKAGDNLESILVDYFGVEVTGQEGPTEEEHQQILRLNHRCLVDNMSPEPVVNVLLSCGVLTRREGADIVDVPTYHTYNKCEALLKVMYEKDEAAFRTFTCALKETEQGHLAERLK